MQIAQVNIARMKGGKSSPVMQDFINNLERINSIADKCHGFVWRLIDEESDDSTLDIFDDNYLLVNLSVWENIDSLFEFTYKSMHLEIFKRKQEWFNKMEKMHMAIWYIENDTIPTMAEAKLRLEYIQAHGATPYAFTFKQRFSEDEFLNYQLD